MLMVIRFQLNIEGATTNDTNGLWLNKCLPLKMPRLTYILNHKNNNISFESSLTLDILYKMPETA
jgi:hypothetical protein